MDRAVPSKYVIWKWTACNRHRKTVWWSICLWTDVSVPSLQTVWIKRNWKVLSVTVSLPLASWRKTRRVRYPTLLSIIKEAAPTCNWSIRSSTQSSRTTKWRWPWTSATKWWEKTPVLSRSIHPTAMKRISNIWLPATASKGKHPVLLSA